MSLPEDTEVINKNLRSFVLNNGLQVVAEHIPYRKTTSIRVVTPVGSRFEQQHEGGFSHFLEHMLFKGTNRRNYSQIAREIDRLGGYINAGTAKEYTGYYITISSRHKHIALDVLADMFYNSTLSEKEFITEKNVILEEIKMAEDLPDDYLFDIHYQHAFPDSALGRPIAGSETSIANATRDGLFSYYTGRYGSRGSILSIAGNLFENEAEYNELKNMVIDLYDREDLLIQGNPKIQNAEFTKTQYGHGVYHEQKKLEQVHFVLSIPSFSIMQEAEYWEVFSNALGGSMSSRLFQKLREENGLCYTIQTLSSRYFAEGLWGIYGATSTDTFFEAVDLTLKELAMALSEGLTTTEVYENISGLSGVIEMSFESASTRASFNGRSLMYYNRLRNYEDRINRIEALTPYLVNSQVQTVLEKPFPVMFTSLGPLDKKQVEDRVQKLYQKYFSI